jgi:GTP pyrophosphokinase
METEIRKITKSCTDAQRDTVAEALSERFGFNSADDFYNAIGYGGVMISKIVTRLDDLCASVIKAEEKSTAPAITEPEQIVSLYKPKNVKSNSGIIVDGESGCMVKFAKCCNPLPGDDVIGFVTKGYGISIHKCDCPNVTANRPKPEYSERWVDARWENEFGLSSEKDLFEANLQIFVRDGLGVLANITKALADMKVSIMAISSSQKGNTGSMIINIKIGCKNVSHFYSIVSKLKTVPNVESVVRGFGA